MKNFYSVLLFIAFALQTIISSSATIENNIALNVPIIENRSENFFALPLVERNAVYINLGNYIKENLLKTAQIYLGVMNSDDFDGVKGISKAGLKAAVISAIHQNFCNETCDKINYYQEIGFFIENILSETPIEGQYADLLVKIDITEWRGQQIMIPVLFVLELKYVRGGEIAAATFQQLSKNHHENRAMLSNLAKEFRDIDYEDIFNQKYYSTKHMQFLSVRDKFANPKIGCRLKRHADIISSKPNLKTAPVIGTSLLGALNRIYIPDVMLLKNDNLIPPAKVAPRVPLGPTRIPLGPISTNRVPLGTINRIPMTADDFAKIINRIPMTGINQVPQVDNRVPLVTTNRVPMNADNFLNTVMNRVPMTGFNRVPMVINRVPMTASNFPNSQLIKRNPLGTNNMDNRLAAYRTTLSGTKELNEFIFVKLGRHIRRTLERTTENYLKFMRNGDIDGQKGMTEADFKVVVLSALANNFCDAVAGICGIEHTFGNIKFKVDFVASEFMIGQRYTDLLAFVIITEINSKAVNMDFILIIELKYIRAGYIKNVWRPGIQPEKLNDNLTKTAEKFKTMELEEIMDQIYRDADTRNYQPIREKLNTPKLGKQIENYVLCAYRQYENTPENDVANNKASFSIIGFGLVGAVNRVISTEYAYFKANYQGVKTDLSRIYWEK